jgi:hypothetical protein
MSAYRRLAPASLAGVALAAVALAVTACGPTSGSTTTPTTQPSSNAAPQAASSSPAPQAASSSPAPQAASSSAAPQANGAFPYAPGGVTYNGGVGGAVETFSIPAGTYSLNQQATYDPATDPDGSDQCLFGGELDYLSGSGGTIQLGDGSVPVTSFVPIEGPVREGSYPAGDYRLSIYPETTCSWTIELWPDR